MIEYLSFRGKKYRTVRLHIRPDADFNDILSELNDIEAFKIEISSEQIMYAILELVNNSLRAHKEKSVDKKILTQFSVNDGNLHVKIQDWGGGFDISSLPYNLNEQTDDVDTNSDTFQEYREEHGYMRFGIGLYIVKKTFDSFRLFFIDENLQPAVWESGNVKGTSIELILSGKKPEGIKDE